MLILFSRFTFLQIASLNSIIPDPAVYLVNPSSIAVFAAFIIFSGVLKSGCPALKLITSCPAYLSSAALDVISRVKEGLTLLTLSANFISEWSVVFYDIQKNYN